MAVAASISSIIRRGLETIEESGSVQQAARKMKDKNVSSLVVVDENDKPKGLVTERDLVRKVCTTDAPVNAVKIKEIMSFPVITINYSSSPSQAADMMLRHNVRHLLVVDNNVNKPIGLVTPRDFTRYQEHVAKEDREAIEKVLEYYV